MVALVVGSVIGVVLGLTGAGGSVLAVPLLIFAVSLPPNIAVALSLATVFVAASIGVATRLRHKEIVWMPAVFFAAGGMLFAPVGVGLAPHIPTSIHMSSFALIMLVIAIRMLVQSIRSPEATNVVRARSDGSKEVSNPICPLSDSNRLEPRFKCISLLALSGALTGVLSGIYGVGGGFLIVPILTAVTQLNMRHAVGTSLFVITLISGMGFLSYLVNQPSELLLENQVSWIVISGAVCGMLVGTLLSRRIAGPRLQQIFVAAIFTMAVFTLFNLDSISV